MPREPRLDIVDVVPAVLSVQETPFPPAAYQEVRVHLEEEIDVLLSVLEVAVQEHLDIDRLVGLTLGLFLHREVVIEHDEECFYTVRESHDVERPINKH